MTTYFRDKHGELWKWFDRNSDLLMRLSDGNIGGWFGGVGLFPTNRLPEIRGRWGRPVVTPNS